MREVISFCFNKTNCMKNSTSQELCAKWDNEKVTRKTAKNACVKKMSFGIQDKSAVVFSEENPADTILHADQN